jgi:hypothetical protein
MTSGYDCLTALVFCAAISAQAGGKRNAAGTR